MDEDDGSDIGVLVQQRVTRDVLRGIIIIIIKDNYY